MMNKCPGQMTNRELDSVVVPCPSCGRLVEMFSDEPKRRCRCGETIRREALPQCADWCPAAAQCLGEAVDVREMKKRMEKVKGDPRAKECLDSIREKLAQKGADDRDAGK